MLATQRNVARMKDMGGPLPPEPPVTRSSVTLPDELWRKLEVLRKALNRTRRHQVTRDQLVESLLAYAIEQAEAQTRD